MNVTINTVINRKGIALCGTIPDEDKSIPRCWNLSLADQ